MRAPPELAYTLVTYREAIVDHNLVEPELESEEELVQEEERRVSRLGHQALWVLLHVLIAAGSWAAMMLIITAMRPEYVPVAITLGLSFTVPLLVGFLFTRFKQNEMAPYTWLIGLIWFLIICLWVLYMPTGPNQCFHCDASQKLYLTFFSFSGDSGLIDNDGRIIGTWPATAFLGYGLGSGLSLKKRVAA